MTIIMRLEAGAEVKYRYPHNDSSRVLNFFTELFPPLYGSAFCRGGAAVVGTILCSYSVSYERSNYSSRCVNCSYCDSLGIGGWRCKRTFVLDDVPYLKICFTMAEHKIPFARLLEEEQQKPTTERELCAFIYNASHFLCMTATVHTMVCQQRSPKRAK